MRTYNLLKSSGFTLIELLICVGLIAIMAGIWSIKNLQSHNTVNDVFCERQLNELNMAVDAFRSEFPEETTLIGNNSPMHTQQVLQALLAKKLIPALPKNPERLQSAGSGDNFYFQRLGNIAVERATQQCVSFTPWSSSKLRQDSPVTENNRSSSPTLSKNETLCKLSNAVLNKAEQDLR